MNQVSYPNIKDGRKVVATAGTAEALVSSNTTCRKVEITAETNNTGYIVVGDSTVVASQATRRGIPLTAGQTITMYIQDLSTVYIDTTVSGDGVTYVYYF